MPADSDDGRADPTLAHAGTSLPHTWRPFGVRVAVGVLGGLLLALVAVVWIALDDATRAQFTTFQRGTLVFIGLMLFAAYYALMRSRVTRDRRRD